MNRGLSAADGSAHANRSDGPETRADAPAGPTSAVQRPALILHIGPHKTGTTYIQHVLAQSRPFLAGHGIAYPDGYLEANGHHALPRQMEAGDTAGLADLRDGLLARGESAVVSSENLSRLTDEQLARLRDEMAPVPVIPIAFVRARGDTIYSQWQEAVKFGERRALPAYLNELLLKRHQANAIDPLRLCHRVAGVFGAIRIFSYEGLKAQGVDLADALLGETFGIPLDGLTRPSRALNTRLREPRVEILRLLNMRHRALGGPPVARIVRLRFLEAVRQDEEIRALALQIARQVSARFDELDLARINDIYAESDRELAEALGPYLPGGERVDPAIARGAGGRTYLYLPDDRIPYTPIFDEIAELYDKLGLAGAKTKT